MKRAEYENKAGALLTPALNATGDLNLSFRAMAYKTCSDRPKGKATEPKDKKGDLTEIVVEVIGGGTIDGATKKVVSGWASSSRSIAWMKRESGLWAMDMALSVRRICMPTVCAEKRSV